MGLSEWPLENFDDGPSLAKAAKSNHNGANLGFEGYFFLAADKLRKNLVIRRLCQYGLPFWAL